MLRNIGKPRIPALCRRDAGWLVRRLCGVDGPSIRCHIAVECEHWRTIDGRRWRIGLALEKSPVELRAQIGRSFAILRSACAYQPKMVQIRTAERAGEVVVGKGIFLRPLPHRQLRAIVISHDETACI